MDGIYERDGLELKNMKNMKRTLLITLCIMGIFVASAQAQHLHEHDYPVVTEENPTIRQLLEEVSADSIEANIAHLSSYWTRRYDSRYIWEVQDWLVSRYQGFGVDTVVLHDFPVPNSDIETADNIIAIQWGTTKPDEFVVCGAHYDSWNSDGADPDTIRSPGADDNASGVAGILETARLLSRFTFDRSIIYANWSAEEIGLVGSAAYAKDMAEQDMDIVGYFNLDMTGYLEEGETMRVHLVYVNRDSLLANFYYNIGRIYYPDLRISQNWMPWGDSDFSSFNRNGYAALHPFENVYHSSPYIHTRQDVLGLSVNSIEQSRQFTQLNLGAVATLAGLNGTSVSENGLTNVVIYPNPAHDAIHIIAEEEIKRITVWNVLGQKIESGGMRRDNKLMLDISHYSPGVYIIGITTERGCTTQKLLVE